MFVKRERKREKEVMQAIENDIITRAAQTYLIDFLKSHHAVVAQSTIFLTRQGLHS